ncbi:uncharacterized protein LOC113316675 [Papaver somniferum]|uniref:uncharacterized protein LOC113316675 n=1 Tax=Papaver somniferum TaxID=3469 RepID=UPI000E6F5920|nr:uncharacterized protein LOC113316675 [Papaver somniferum]
MAVILLYVDDIIMTCSSPTLSDHIVNFLMQIYPVKNLGSLHCFLGIKATFQNNSQQLLLTQKKYTLQLLQKYDLLNYKSSKTPITKGTRLSISTGVLLSDATEYRRMVGALQYLTMTRPDICFSVNYVAQFMQSPTDEHLFLVKRILRYLKGIVGTGVLLFAGDISSISAYSDSNWEGCPDTKRSTSGMCVFLGSSLVSWSSKKHPTISKHNTSLWILLQQRCPATNPVFHARTKHIEIDYHFIRELVSSGFPQVSYVSSANQIADLFTKGLVLCVFLSLAGKLLYLHQYQLEWGCKDSEMSESCYV